MIDKLEFSGLTPKRKNVLETLCGYRTCNCRHRDFRVVKLSKAVEFKTLPLSYFCVIIFQIFGNNYFSTPEKTEFCLYIYYR